MVFRAFLEQRRSWPRRGRAHLGSLLLHLAVCARPGASPRASCAGRSGCPCPDSVLAVTAVAAPAGVPVWAACPAAPATAPEASAPRAGRRRRRANASPARASVAGIARAAVRASHDRRARRDTGEAARRPGLSVAVRARG